MSSCKERYSQHNCKANRATKLPEVLFGLICLGDTLEVHAEVAGEEGEWKENNSNAGKEKNCLVLVVGNNGKLILLNGSQLEQLRVGSEVTQMERTNVILTASKDFRRSISNSLAAVSLSFAILAAQFTRSIADSPPGKLMVSLDSLSAPLMSLSIFST